MLGEFLVPFNHLTSASDNVMADAGFCPRHMHDFSELVWHSLEEKSKRKKKTQLVCLFKLHFKSAKLKPQENFLNDLIEICVQIWPYLVLAYISNKHLCPYRCTKILEF